MIHESVEIGNRARTKYYKREWTAIFIGERMPSGIACNRATRIHARKLGSRRACSSREERDCAKGAYLSLSSAITSGWSKSTRHGISEIIISQSLAGWQICQQGVKCQLLRDRGIWINFFHGYRRHVQESCERIWINEFSKAAPITFHWMAWCSGSCYKMMVYGYILSAFEMYKYLIIIMIILKRLIKFIWRFVKHVLWHNEK